MFQEPVAIAKDVVSDYGVWYGSFGGRDFKLCGSGAFRHMGMQIGNKRYDILAFKDYPLVTNYKLCGPPIGIVGTIKHYLGRADSYLILAREPKVVLDECDDTLHVSLVYESLRVIVADLLEKHSTIWFAAAETIAVPEFCLQTPVMFARDDGWYSMQPATGKLSRLVSGLNNWFVCRSGMQATVGEEFNSAREIQISVSLKEHPDLLPVYLSDSYLDSHRVYVGTGRFATSLDAVAIGPALGNIRDANPELKAVYIDIESRYPSFKLSDKLRERNNAKRKL